MSDEPQIPLDDLKTKCDEAMAGWKRALADYDNVKKDLVRERAAMRREANLSAALSFLAVLDNFDQALKHVPDVTVLSRAQRGTTGDPSSDADSGKHVPDVSSRAERGISLPDVKLQQWLQGILHIRTQLETALRDLGLEPFGAVGETFDPNLHDAVASSGVILSEAKDLSDSSPEPALSEVEEAQNDKNTERIVSIVRRGWKMGDKVVRSASVVVSK